MPRFTSRFRHCLHSATSTIALLAAVAAPAPASAAEEAQVVEAAGTQLTDAAVAEAPAAKPAGSADAASSDVRDNSILVDEILITARGIAADLAPTKNSLDATQPQAIFDRRYIEDAVPQTADFNQIVLISPSLSGSYANGPGFAESKTVLRGFQDGEYNITFDGIPWGDTNNPTHHSTSFFPASTIGSLVVDRGPGNAGQLARRPLAAPSICSRCLSWMKWRSSKPLRVAALIPIASPLP